MSGIFLRWGVPALLTVVGGTTLAVTTTSGAMTADLTMRATDALADGDLQWASVTFDVRDAIVSGTATSKEMIESAVARIATVHGVRSVRAEVTLAQAASPYLFHAAVKGETVSLSGGVPDEISRVAIRQAAGATDDELRLLSGAPEKSAWRAAVDYGLAHLQQFDEGEVTLSDLAISIAGRAKSREAFDALVALESTPLPEGATIAAREIIPPLASPFEWHAVYDGARVAISGFAPSDGFATELEAAAGGKPVSTSLLPASGAPTGFEATARTLLENLVLLEEGRADISGSTATLEGAPPDAATAARVEAEMAELGATLTLAPPRVEAYAFVATRADGTTTLTGHVPDAATRDRLEALEGVDAAGLELARGAPERFDAAVDYGLDLLGHLSEGRFAVDGASLTIEGRAATAADLAAVETSLALGAPQGLILAATDIKPPIADPFVWSAEKTADGEIGIEGFVPSQETRRALLAAAGGTASDASSIADGAPPNFEKEATAALAILPLLQSGRIDYDGARWALTGAVATPQEAFTAEQAFAKSGLRAAGWSFALELPEAPEVAELPVIDPYTWRAEKAADGVIKLGGFVPTEGLKRILVARAGEGAIDDTNLGAGDPEGFVGGTLAGIDALAALDEGTLSFDGATWSLSGKVKTDGDKAAIEGALTAAVDPADWQIAITAPAPVAAPVPKAPVEPAAPAAEEPAVANLPDAPAAPAETPATQDFVFRATKPLDGAIVLEGAVPAEPARRFFGVVAGDVPTDNVTIAPDLPSDFIGNADAGLRALASFDAGEFGFDGTSWVLRGRVETEAARKAALEALAAIPAAAGWQTDVTLLAPIDICRRKVAAFASRNAILFQSGSARLAGESLPALDELAGYLGACPDATVHVEGHTDADGDDDLNLALSVARAEAVVDALIERGIGYQRLYAVGYGESLPVADNESAAGKRANRRIAFTILDEPD